MPGLLSAQPSELKFDHLTTIDGLSHNNVQCILQDKQGYIWFGTNYGLNRYDGYEFKVFESIPGDSSSIVGNNILCLYQDKDDLIWIGTSTSSFSSYNPRTELFTNYLLPQGQARIDEKDSLLRTNPKYVLHPVQAWIHDFEEDENGLLWLATGSGLFSFDKKTHNATYHPTDDSARENVHSILKDKNKNILWLSSETGIRKFNKKTGSVKLYPVPYPAFFDLSREMTHHLMEDRHGNLWMTTSDYGVWQLNPETEKLTSYHINITHPSDKRSRITTQLMEDADGKIWIGGEGLAFFDPSAKSISLHKQEIENPEGIPGVVNDILKDRSGIYWVGTMGGIAKYDPRMNNLINIKAQPPYTLQTANTLIEDEDQNIWFGNYYGLGIVDTTTGFYKLHNEILHFKEPCFFFSSLHGKDGSMWWGSTSQFFHVYKKGIGKGPENYTSDRIVLPIGGKVGVMALALNDEGILWIGTRGGGLFRYNPSLKTFKRYQGTEENESMFSATTIWSLHAISADSLLIGAEGEGLILMHTKTERFEKIAFEKNANNSGIDYLIINSICEDQKKNIWMATQSGGLWQTDASLLNFKNHSGKDGLQSMNISQIVEDDKGKIWLNTNRGIEVLDPVEKKFLHYSAKDGLSTLTADYLIKKSAGDLFFVDFNCLHIFRTSGIYSNKEPPPVYINRIKIKDQDIPIYNDTTIHLTYSQNFISFEYVALNYTQSYKNKYAYKLEGLEKNWIDAGERRFASYTNLHPGTYTFHVKACNNDGVWNETGARLTLIIFPPWWRTWWFYALCFVTVTAAVSDLFRYRLQQKLKAIEMRNTISRDLHDEVGSTLSSIGFLSSMALDDANNNNGKARSTLSRINESSHKMLEAMNDIIWNIQPQNDTLENIVARMVSFASELLEAQKITMNCHVADNVQQLHLGVTVRHDFFMIFKEAVNNLAKYSAATEANINLEFRHPYLILTITDNGKGFDPQAIKNGNGLKNMQCRAKKIGAIYQLNTVAGKGTSVTLQVKPT